MYPSQIYTDGKLSVRYGVLEVSIHRAVNLRHQLGEYRLLPESPKVETLSDRCYANKRSTRQLLQLRSYVDTSIYPDHRFISLQIITKYFLASLVHTSLHFRFVLHIH